jgi:hypothetical protein
MSKRALFALSICAAAVAISMARAGQSTPESLPQSGLCEAAAAAPAPIQVAQASACRQLGHSCGTQVINGNSACCDGLVCANGACANYRRANEACGPGVPPCAPGLSCQSGMCR